MTEINRVRQEAASFPAIWRCCIAKLVQMSNWWIVNVLA